jgi:SpoVK/Ycf46/Vps4 family AAA+-type ATPase
VYDRWGFNSAGGTGLVALFAGGSGTGKTLSAEVIGTTLGLDVYKVDLSSLVSKYIGETEKNLERIFDAASAGNVILFFDEADALFGKRSEVSDSHDRYANIEVAYLLQRIEAYDGIVVLATNLRANLDDAFLRRIHVSVDFRDPDEAQRLQIWQKSFPKDAPIEDLDLPWLAKSFRITGGNIRNAATTAAFLAAEADRAIAMEDVVRGIDREFEKLGRLRTEADFGPYFQAISQD